IKEEFKRITVELETTFRGNLDKYTGKLPSLFRTKGCAAGQKMDNLLDVLKQAVKKLAGAAGGTMAWVTNVGNEHRQVLTFVLTAHEDASLLPMVAGLMARYSKARVPPSKLLYVDRDCNVARLREAVQAEMKEKQGIVGLSEEQLDSKAACWGTGDRGAHRAAAGCFLWYFILPKSQRELIGVEYLYAQQCRELRDDIGRDPDAPDGDLDDEAELEDEGFEDKPLPARYLGEEGDPTIDPLSALGMGFPSPVLSQKLLPPQLRTRPCPLGGCNIRGGRCPSPCTRTYGTHCDDATSAASAHEPPTPDTPSSRPRGKGLDSDHRVEEEEGS
ncbi:hypothetical protein NFI96_002751, partial [Prochilodus magdalenae]